MSPDRGTRLPAAIVLCLVAILYLAAAANQNILIAGILDGWILNPNAYPWFRLSSLFFLIDFSWRVVAIVPALLSAAGILVGKRWASAVGKVIGVAGIVFALASTGSSALLAWSQHRALGSYQKLLVLFAIATLASHVLLLTFLRSNRPPAEP